MTMTDLESTFDDAEQIFVELSNSQRLEIIHSLHRQKLNLAGLSKELGVTMQEVHRNLNRLMEAGLIEKKSSGVFSLTTFGSAYSLDRSLRLISYRKIDSTSPIIPSVTCQ